MKGGVHTESTEAGHRIHRGKMGREEAALASGEESAPPLETDADPGRGIPLHGYRTKN
jgi:hypothetical protein